MHREISNHFDDKGEYAPGGLSDAIGSMLSIGLAAVVGFFALAILLPIWDTNRLI
jgi:type IV pilus assembly protein PilC